MLRTGYTYIVTRDLKNHPAGTLLTVIGTPLATQVIVDNQEGARFEINHAGDIEESLELVENCQPQEKVTVRVEEVKQDNESKENREDSSRKTGKFTGRRKRRGYSE